VTQPSRARSTAFFSKATQPVLRAESWISTAGYQARAGSIAVYCPSAGKRSAPGPVGLVRYVTSYVRLIACEGLSLC